MIAAVTRPAGLPFRSLIAATLLFLLAACSGGGSPGKFADVNDGPTGKPVPPVTLTSIEGLNSAKRQALGDALAAEAGKHDIGIVEGSLDNTGLSLAGNFRLTQDGAQATLSYRWQLTDKAGALVHTVEKDEVGLISAPGNPWSAVSPAMLQRVAAYTAKSMADRLAQLGYATIAEGRGQQAGDALATASIEPEAKPGAKAKAHAIKAVAVLPVTGFGGPELTTAMRKTLKKAGWPVLSAPRADAITIQGRVTGAAEDKVKLTWTVKTPDGRVLGTINQSNTVPASGWGDNARFAAQAAADGIYDLIDKLR